MVTRENILLQIKHMAARDGNTPSRRSFAKETGIPDSAWQGKYWARWSDAVREADCEPNVFRQAYDADWTLRSLAEIVRLHSRFPTEPELKLRRREDANFPTGAILNIGSRADRINKLADFCERNDGYDDVLEIILPDVNPSLPAVDTEDSDSPASGFVYMFRVGKHFKIGSTGSVARREREIQLQLPKRAEKIHVIETDDRYGIERYWHRRFAAKRANGEWFELSRSDVAAFKKRTKFM